MANTEGFDFEFTQIDNDQRSRFSAYLPIDVARALHSALGRVNTIKDVNTRRVTQVHEDVAGIPSDTW